MKECETRLSTNNFWSERSELINFQFRQILRKESARNFLHFFIALVVFFNIVLGGGGIGRLLFRISLYRSWISSAY
jgi:predicted Zn-dependent peptidase